ncbi:MAG: prolyl oligopeptidase family serine peptidase [Thermomicrobiales bacterium]
MHTMTPERAVYDLATGGDPQISPDGARVVYVVSRNHRESPRQTAQLWECAADGTGHRLVASAGSRNWQPRWSHDGARLAFLSNRSGGTSIVLLGSGMGDPRILTTHQGAIGGLAWAPDDATLVYTTMVDPANPDETPRPADAPAPIRVTRRNDYKQDEDARGWVGETRSQIWLLDVASGERRQLTADPVDHVNPHWSPDGTKLAAQLPNRNHVATQLGIFDARSGERLLVIGPEQGMVETWVWTPDGAGIVFAGETSRTWQLEWFRADAATGEVTRLTDDHGIAPASGWSLYGTPARPVWVDERRIAFTGARAARNGIYLLDAVDGSVSTLQEAPARNAGLSADRDQRFVVQASSSHGHAGEIALIDARTGTTRLLTDLNGAVLAESPLAGAEQFTIERGGMAIDAWLLKPADYDPGKRYPLVLDIHGGPNGVYGYDVSNVQQTLASAGFLVLYANPRGSSSYGREFVRAVASDWGGEDYLDLMAVVDHAIQRPDVDPARLGVYGYSYGGYMTSWIIGHTDRFRAAVIGAPVVDLVSFFGTSDIGYYWGLHQFGGLPQERPEWYRERSPITHVHAATTPALILHGEGDARCPIGQGEQLFTALREAGVETEFVRYPGMTHLFLWGGEPVYVEDYLARTLEWFQTHL